MSVCHRHPLGVGPDQLSTFTAAPARGRPCESVTFNANPGLAVNSQRKDESGQWVDKPNYFDVTVWDKQGENCAQFLAKGRPVAIDGRLDWREWQTQDGQKREAVEVVAESVQFLGSRSDGDLGGGGNQFVPAGASSGADADFQGTDDDIPF